MGDNYITCRDENGSINISEEVIANLVRNSISEVDGVAGMANAAGAEIAEFIGIKTLNKGVKVQFDDDTIIVDAVINVRYGSNILSVAKRVQSEVLTMVQSTTGIDKAQVNIHVSGVAFDK